MIPIDINSIGTSKIFSVCTLVTSTQEYEEMVASFHKAGFTDENSEFLYADNSAGNQYDGFTGVRAFLTKSTAQYVIICHQDVVLSYDGFERLSACVEELEKTDPHWAIAGNAGYVDSNRKAIRISDPYGKDVAKGPFPAKVRSLDENFLIVKRSSGLTPSHDLRGFHFYATDLCLIADILGYNAYVIDFHLYHKSGGHCDESFFNAKQRLIDKYRRVLQSRFVRTTCTPLYLSGCSFLNSLFNRKLMYSLKKRIDFIHAKLS
jgi:hypothetical protein